MAAITASEAGDPGQRIERVRRVLVRVLVAELAVLGTTGAYLVFFYRPTAAQAWGNIYGLQSEVGYAMQVRTLHRWTAWLTIATTLVLATVFVAEGISRWSGPPRRRRAVVVGPLVLLVTLFAWFSGTWLPWDQVALRAVTVGTNVRGYGAIFDDGQTRFVLVNGVELSLGTAQALLIAHVVVLPAILLGLLGFGSRRARSAGPATTTAADAGADRQDLVIAANAEGGAH